VDTGFPKGSCSSEKYKHDPIQSDRIMSRRERARFP
jgi:hypothetical protein